MVVGATLVVGFLAWPMLFTSSGMGQDWSNHLWYLWRQSIAINRDHEPSLFLDYPGSVFYPFYAFYGGTIYAIFGGLAVLLGNTPVTAYLISYLLGFAAAYGGWYLLARMAGLGRWQAQVPGLLFITSAYYLTLIYARGDWPEFIAVSMLPLFVAAGLRVLMVDRFSLRWATLLVVCALVFFGSHNITMLWAVTSLFIIGSAIAIAAPQVRARITLRGLIRVAGLVIPAALVNAWYLFPTLAYGGRSAIAETFNYGVTLHRSAGLVSVSHLFTFSRASIVKSTPDFVLALPVLAVAWVVVSIPIAFILKGETVWRRIMWISAAVSVGFTVLMVHVGLILSLPHPYTLLQFSYRLEAYVLFGLCGAVVAILALARTWPRRWRTWSWTMIIVLVASGIGAVQQVDNYPRGDKYPGVVHPDRYVAFNPQHQPPFGGGLDDYDDATLPLAERSDSHGEVVFPEVVYNEKVTVPVDLAAGVLVHTNLKGAPDLVKVEGAKVVGEDRSRSMVLEIQRTKRSPGEVTLSRASDLPVAGGRLVTRLAISLLVLYVVLGLAWRFRGRARMRRSG